MKENGEILVSTAVLYWMCMWRETDEWLWYEEL